MKESTLIGVPKATEIERKVAFDTEGKKYWVWGVDVSGDKCLVVTSKNKAPVPKYSYLIYEIIGKPTAIPISIKNKMVPSVGDICKCNDGGNVIIYKIL